MYNLIVVSSLMFPICESDITLFGERGSQGGHVDKILVALFMGESFWQLKIHSRLRAGQLPKFLTRRFASCFLNSK